jgi:PAP2 superfamily
MEIWDWQTALTVAVVLLSVALVGATINYFRPYRPVTFLVAAAREAGLILALFALWQIVRILAIKRVSGGLRNGEWIWHAERWTHLPSELTLERFMLRHEWALRWANDFYGSVHFPAMVVFLVWLFIRHRDRFPLARDAIVLLTGSCLLIQVFLPVAPPRMLTSVGFIDEAVQLGQSVYGAFGSGVAAQLSAMPSVHVAWAFLIAVEVIQASPSRWRWLIVLHPVVTTFVVVVTANHYWADGIIAVALLVLAELGSHVIVNAQRSFEASRFWPFRPRPESGAQPRDARESDDGDAPEPAVPATQAATVKQAGPGARPDLDRVVLRD